MTFENKDKFPCELQELKPCVRSHLTKSIQKNVGRGWGGASVAHWLSRRLSSEGSWVRLLL